MNFRQVRKKIKTIGNVKQITKAMQMVSSVKMKKAQDAAIEGRFYRNVLDEIMNKVLDKSDVSETGFMGKVDRSNASKKIYIVISSNKGLCGSFNFNVLKLLLKSTNFEKDEFITLGKKGADFLLKMRGSIIADFSATTPISSAVSPVFSLVQEKFATGQYKAVYVVYNQFISTLKQQPVSVQMLPIDDVKKEIVDRTDKKETASAQYVIEPSVSEVFESLLLDFLHDKLRGALLDSEAAEHSARMMAMKNATDSAGELVHSLTLLGNKLRQASITNELLEITTATISSEGSN